MTTVELLNRKAQKSTFSLPIDWVRVEEGPTKDGDRWWRWCDESWQPVDRQAFLGVDVSLLQCVIRKLPLFATSGATQIENLNLTLRNLAM